VRQLWPQTRFQSAALGIVEPEESSSDAVSTAVKETAYSISKRSNRARRFEY